MIVSLTVALANPPLDDLPGYDASSAALRTPGAMQAEVGGYFAHQFIDNELASYSARAQVAVHESIWVEGDVQWGERRSCTFSFGPGPGCSEVPYRHGNLRLGGSVGSERHRIALVLGGGTRFSAGLAHHWTSKNGRFVWDATLRVAVEARHLVPSKNSWSGLAPPRVVLDILGSVPEMGVTFVSPEGRYQYRIAQVGTVPTFGFRGVFGPLFIELMGGSIVVQNHIRLALGVQRPR